MIEVLKWIIWAVPFVLLCFAVKKTNLNKAERGKQFIIPIVAVIYCIVAIYFLEKINALLTSGIQFLAKFIPMLRDFNISKYMIYISNIAILFVFMLIKNVLLPIVKGIWGKSHWLMEHTAGICYEYEEDIDKWMLKKRYGQVKVYYVGIYSAALIASTAVMVLSKIYPDAAFFKATFYPAIGIIILGEVVNFLSGLTKAEFIEDILGEDEESYRVANYGLLRDILRGLFGNRVLYDATMDDGLDGDTNYETLEEMCDSDNQTVANLGQYFKTLKESGEEIDANYAKSALHLVQGQSTLFLNPFYKDLTNYVIFPMIRQLMRYRKCLVVTGRDSSTDDVKEWLKQGVFDFVHTDSLWKVEILSKYITEADIGIIKFSDLYNLEIQKNNEDFLKKVGFVFIVEPSRLLATGQMGLSLLVNYFDNSREEVVYAACDRNCDGLVDALSHTLKTNITEVAATSKGGTMTSVMCWEADGPYMHHKIYSNISRYLGIGTEINSVAMKYQIPDTSWISSDKFPVLDMKWIAGQYYKKICDYTNLPISQEAFNKAFHVDSNLWNTSKKQNSFLVVEDEFQNLFELVRVFSTRAEQQGFVNVISENYLLRDYMLDNVLTFVSDPKAIPTIVADYARTERNTVLKLIMRMTENQVSEEEIVNALMISGIKFEDAFETLKELIRKHCTVNEINIRVYFREQLMEDALRTEVKKYYAIEGETEIAEYAKNLRNAYYIAEDEKGETYHIGAKLYGHVFQAMIPGQFLTFAGKYYEVQSITPQNGVVVRRAADHITDRKYYRQLRHIQLSDWKDDVNVGAQRNVANIQIDKGYCQIHVDTEGYLEMASYEDFKTAKRVTVSGIPGRSYRNKLVLKIKLPESTEKVRYTICMLLNEIFKTTYPDAYPYICAVTKVVNEDTVSERLKDIMYTLDTEMDSECIYIVEDSEIDLGLIDSVDRNLKRYFEILTEVLMWHDLKMNEKPKEEPTEEYVPEFDPEPEDTKKKGFFGKAWDKVKGFFGKLFKRKPKKTDETEETEETPEGIAEGETPETPEDAETATQEGEQPVVPEGEEATVAEGEEATVPEGEEATAPEGEEATAPEETVEETPKKKGFFGRIAAFFGRLFKRKPKEEAPTEEIPTEEVPEEETPVEEVPVEEPPVEEPPVEETPIEEVTEEETSAEADTQVQADVLRDELDEQLDIEGEDEELVEPEDADIRMTNYQENCFLKFGYDEFDECLDFGGVVEYLVQYGYDKNPLSQVRSGAELAEEYEKTYDPSKNGAHFCDFCGVELLGGEYEVLKDGRERCNRCSMSALRTGEEFKEIFKTVMRNMEIFYGIKINVAIKVRMTDAKKIAKHFGETFVATPGFDGRTLGFAQKDSTGYSIYVENGSPKLAAMATIAHELTHIWQYLNWNDKEIVKKYGKHNRLEVYEGMAKWAEIQYLLYLNEVAYAKRQEITTRMRDDAYGKGFIKYAEKYPLSYTQEKSKTPFEQIPPL